MSFWRRRWRQAASGRWRVVARSAGSGQSGRPICSSRTRGWRRRPPDDFGLGLRRSNLHQAAPAFLCLRAAKPIVWPMPWADDPARFRGPTINAGRPERQLGAWGRKGEDHGSPVRSPPGRRLHRLAKGLRRVRCPVPPMGVVGHAVHQALDDPNDVTVWHDFTTRESAQAFIAHAAACSCVRSHTSIRPSINSSICLAVAVLPLPSASA
jgi:hypothetical protein